MYKLLVLISLFFVFSFCRNSEVKEKFVSGSFEINGVSFVGMNYKNEEHFVSKLKDFSINWMSQMPFAFQRNNEPTISFNNHHQWWGESSEGITQTTIFAKRFGIKTMLKPQLWMGGEYTGKLNMNSEEDWKKWEDSYSNFILYFAQLADSLNHESFCIGTELQSSIDHNPKFWIGLIDSIRTFYTGKLTYASNWNEYQQVTFWNKLDWIGVNGYFPLSKNKTPKVNELLKAWKKIIPDLKALSDSVQKPIVFTEIGYKSVDACAFEPWNPKSKEVNLLAQDYAYKAFMIAFQGQKWFKGYFLWKWYPDHKKSGGHLNTDYTPQNKLAEFWLKK